MAEPSLVELIEKQRTGDLTASEQKVLNQKLGNLDVVASEQGAISLRPTGNRTYGQYNFYIDWANDGAPADGTGAWLFDGVYDNLSQRFVSADIMRGMAGENAYCAIPAQIEIQLDNTDNYLASDNTDSPINAYVIGSVKKRCKLEIVVNGTAYQQFDGWVKEIAANPSTHGRKMATVVIDDLMGRLKSAPMISTIRTDATEVSALAMCLSTAVWAAYGSAYYGAAYYGGGGVYGGAQVLTPVYDSASDSFAYVGDTWRESETSVLDAIQDIMRSCLGVFYTSRTGVPTYRARTYRPLNATVSDWAGAGSTRIMKVDAVGIQDETLFNEVQFTISQRKAGTPASVLWTLRDTPTISAGATLTYVANFSDSGTPCGCVDPVTPLIGTDYTNDANLSVAVVWRAADALVSVTNSGASPISSTLLQLRGTPITVMDKTLFKKTGSSAIKKTLWHDAPLLSNTVAAASYVDWLYSLFSLYTDKARQVTIVPGSATDLEAVAQLDMNRRITLIDGSIAYVNWVHHSITSSLHTVTLGLSPAISSVMWILGTSELGTDNALGV